MYDIRTFIALTLPPDIHGHLSDVIRSLKREIGDRVVRWVAADNIHLTLKFLGEIPGKNIPQLAVNLGECAITHSPFALAVQGLGAFPRINKPRVIWVGISESKELMLLQKQIEQNTRQLGYEAEDRPFSAHLLLLPNFGAFNFCQISAYFSTHFGVIFIYI